MSIQETLLNKIDIVDFIGQYTELRKESKGYKAKCPLHDGQSDASLWVTPETNSFYCFSCCTGGNAIHFYAQMEGYGYFQAVESLAERYNLQVENDKQFMANKDVIKRNVVIQQKLVKRLPHVIEYLKVKRMFTEDTINEFGIGYDDVGTWPVQDKSGKKVFKGITIPIYDMYNRLIAYGKRRLPGDEQKPKYLNTYDWDLYHKGKTLFNLNKIHKMVKEQKVVFLTEGFFDVMSFHQQQLPAVGYCCATLSKDHIRLLNDTFKHIKGLTVVLAADNDAAGIGKIARMRELFQKEAPKMNVRVLLYPDDCKDANDLLINNVDIKSLPTEHIDLFCVKQILQKYKDKEQQYSEVESFITTVKNQLVKADICSTLADYWKQDIKDVKKQFDVVVDNANEILQEFKSANACIKEMEESILNFEGITTGYQYFDYATKGLSLTDVFFIAARPGIGKTFVGMEIALHMAIRLKLNIVFFSLEMSAAKLYKRIVANVYSLSVEELEEKVKKKEMDYGNILDKIKEYLYIDDNPSVSIDDIEKRVVVINKNNFFKYNNGKTQVVLIDYVQMMPKMSNFEYFEEKVMSFKPIARRLNVLLIPLSQMSRMVKSWEEPDISNMKGGGAIEAVADIAWLLWKESENPKISELDRDTMKEKGEDNIICSKIGKARNDIKEGASKYIKLISDRKTTSVKELPLKK